MLCRPLCQCFQFASICCLQSFQALALPSAADSCCAPTWYIASYSQVSAAGFTSPTQLVPVLVPTCLRMGPSLESFWSEEASWGQALEEHAALKPPTPFT